MARKRNEDAGREGFCEYQEMALKSVSIKGAVIDNFSDFIIRQTYMNDISDNIEAVYTFPLPDDASVYRFKARTAGRDIVGAILEREKAVKEYGKAIVDGDGAALFESHRPNIFQISLGQIGAGEEVEIEIGYAADLKISGDEMRILTPLVTAPRYIPAGAEELKKTGTGNAAPNNRVPDADMITPPNGSTSYRATAEISFDIGCGAEAITSPSHAIKVVEDDFGWVKVTFADDSVKLDRDFVLNAKFPKTRPERFLCGTASTGEVFSYISARPDMPESEDEPPREYFFLIDVSGSMDGRKLDEAKKALKICLRNLSARDRFNMIAFESFPHPFKADAVEYTQRSLEEATRWVDNLCSMGGTEILKSVEMALAGRGGLEKIVMLMTDGEVGNEGEVIAHIKKHGANSRFFTVGIDTAVNSHFINSIAEASSGAAEFVYPGEPLDDKILRHFARISCARIEDLKLTVAGCAGVDPASDMPAMVYSGDNFTALVKLASSPSGCATITGRVSAGECDPKTAVSGVDQADKKGAGVFTHTIEKAELSDDGDMLARLWAMRRIRKLEKYEADCNPRRAESVTAKIVELSEKYSVLSKYTAFFARITRENKLSGMPETTVVKVEIPAGWDMFNNKFMTAIGGSMNIYTNIGIMPSMISRCASAPPPPSPKKAAPAGPKTRRFEEKIDSKILSEISYCNLESDKSDSENICYSPIRGGESHDYIQRGPASELKRLSMSQNADGSFGPPNSSVERLVKETSEAILKFTRSGEDLDIYRKILNKAVKFILASLDACAGDSGVESTVKEAVLECIDLGLLAPANMKLAENFLKKTGK